MRRRSKRAGSRLPAQPGKGGAGCRGRAKMSLPGPHWRDQLSLSPPGYSARWYVARERAEETSTRLFRPSTVAFDGQTTWVLLEGEPADLVEQADRARLEPADDPPPLPDAAHRGRISVIFN